MRDGEVRNLCGFSPETVAAEYETDAALAEWCDGSELPPDGHYFYAAWAAEMDLREEDFKWMNSSKGSSSASGMSTGIASS